MLNRKYWASLFRIADSCRSTASQVWSQRLSFHLEAGENYNHNFYVLQQLF